MPNHNLTGKDSRNRIALNQYWALKREVVEHYSESPDGIIRPRCRGCGELDLEILVIVVDQAILLEGYGSLYRKLKMNHYPEGFKVLCLKCQRKDH